MECFRLNDPAKKLNTILLLFYMNHKLVKTCVSLVITLALPQS